MATELYFPMRQDWERTSAAEAAWDADALLELARYCAQCGSSQLVILDHGRILAEYYWSGSDPTSTRDVASVQKVAVSVLLDILAGTGSLSFDDPVASWLGRGWSRAAAGQEESIQLIHLMTMTSGLYDDFTAEAAAGTTWYYNNNAYHQLRRVIELAARAPFAHVFDESLARPIGMHSACWVDRRGTADPNGRVLSGLACTARDLARIELLVLGDGSWSSQAVLPDRQSLAVALRPSQALNPSYGRLWWLPTEPAAILPGGAMLDPRKSFGGFRLDGPIIPAAPPGTVAAFGAGVQRLYVSPSLGVVAVRLGSPPSGDRTGQGFDHGFWQRLMAAAPVTH